MSAEVLSFARGCELLRPAQFAAMREHRIRIRRVSAYRRAVAGEFSDADRAMFGDPEQLIREGPGLDPRLARADDPGAA